MKNKFWNLAPGITFPGAVKMSLKMKLTLCILLFSLWGAMASESYSQTKKLTLDFKGASVRDVLGAIENQSEFFFLYSEKLIDVNREINIEVQGSTIEKILDKVFEGTNVKHSAKGRQIVLTTPEANNIDGVFSDGDQQKSVSGKVTSVSGEPLPGVTVIEKGTANGTITDVDGNYSISNISEKAILQFSFIGMISQEVVVGGNTQISVSLSEGIIGIDEVVAIGYGTQKRETLTGSVSNIKGSDLAAAPVTNVSNSLSGKLAGVFVSTNSSEPGSDGSTINIRGINTFGNSAPLVVVDGVPGRSLDRIDPNTIDNISVLKDASAAIYGAQAANGVILITTKRGKAGKPSIALSYNQGMGKPTNVTKMANSYEYTSLISENEIANGLPLTYSPADVKKYQDGSDPLGHPSTDWYSEVFKNWSLQNSANLSISGGSEDFKYFLSGSSKFQDGFYRNSASNYSQQDMTINLDGKINESISLAVNVVGRVENTNAPSTVSYGGGIFETVSRSRPMERAYWPNGLPGPGVEGGMNPILVVTDQMGYNKDKRYIFNSNLNLKIEVPWVKGLSVNLMAALDEAFHYNKLWQVPWSTYSWDGVTKETDGNPKLTKSQFGPGGTLDPKLAQNSDRVQNLLTTAQFNYKFKIEDNNTFDLLGGVEKIKYESSGMYGYRRGFISSAVDELSFGGPLEKTTFGTSSAANRLNYFGRLNFNRLNKYLVELQFRYQGSYIFYKDNRFGFFPGVSLGYVVSEEDYWKNTIGNSISFFKIRASVGKTGNDLVNPYQYLASYYKGDLDMVTGGNPEAAIYENVAPNINATWESVTQNDLGFDLRFLDNAIWFTFDYFNNQRSNILAPKNAAVPASTGLTLPNENIGKVDTKGFDFDITYRSKPNASGLNYQISLNGVYSKNKLIYWAENPGAPDWQLAEGSPLFAELYYESLGIFKDKAAVDAYPHWAGAMPGDVIFRDVNDDKEINDLDKVRRKKNNFPTTSGALSFSAQYKGFDFTALLQGAAGAERYIFGYAGGVGNYFKDFYDNRWTPENPNASGPRAYNRNNEYWATSDDWTHQSTQFLYKTDYIRLKNIELGYNLPSVLLNKIGVSNVRFYVSAYNLFTYCPGLKDFDPEKSEIRGFGYPQQKVINFGTSLKF